MGQNFEVPVQKARATTLNYTGTLLSTPTCYRFVPSTLAIKILLTEGESLLTAIVASLPIF